MPRKPVPCRICREPVVPGMKSSPAGPAHRRCIVESRKHGTETMYHKGLCRCQECRDAIAAAMRRRNAARKATTGHGYGHGRERNPDEGKRDRTCTQCGEVFFGFGELFCSRACFARSNRLVQTTGLVPAPPRVRPSWSGSSVSRGWTFVSGPCAWCGVSFTIAHQKTSRYCSVKCSRAAARAQRGRFSVPPYVRLSIYERDEWTCQLCGDPVDRSGSPFGPWAPSLDHIECQSWVLIPDHSPTNLRTAHRWCNSARGDESWGKFAKTVEVGRRS